MKTLILALLLLVRLSAIAAVAADGIPPRLAAIIQANKAKAPPQTGTTINLDNVRIEQLATIIFGEILKENFVMDPQLLKNDQAVRVHVDLPQEPAKARPVLFQVLQSVGVGIEQKAGVWILQPYQDQTGQGGEPFIYRPKYRDVGYLVDLVGGMFPSGSFAYHRGVQNPGASTTKTPASATAQETGTNAYSVIDKPVDTLIFHGSEKDTSLLQKLLAQLDTPTPEILVKAVVFEVTTDNSDQSALTMAAQLLGGKLGLSLGTATTADYTAFFKGASFQAVFNALSTDRRFKAVSSPQLRVQNGSSAQLTVGSDTPVLGNVSYNTTGQATQSVDYKSSGVILNLKPQIRENTADLQISQQISNFINTTTGVNNSPTLIKREIQTTVGIGADDVLVIGGLDQDTTTKSTDGLSFLPSWLSSRSSDRSKTEVLLILQATRI